jgi:hypothetical protein
MRTHGLGYIAPGIAVIAVAAAPLSSAAASPLNAG